MNYWMSLLVGVWWKISSIEVFAKERGIFFEKLQTFNDFELLSPKLSVL